MMRRSHTLLAPLARPQTALLCLAASLGVGAAVLAGDLNPPAGPIAPTGPDLADILNAAQGGSGGATIGEAEVLASLPEPTAGAFSEVRPGSGVLRRVVVTQSTVAIPLTIHVRDASGLITQLRPVDAGTDSYELGVGYTGGLSVAVVGGTLGTFAITFVCE